MKFMYINLKGVAVGCGWQTFVAFVNVGCYYVVGVPLGALLGFYFKLGAKVIDFTIFCYHSPQPNFQSQSHHRKNNNIIVMYTGYMVRNAGRYGDANNHFNMDHGPN